MSDNNNSDAAPGKGDFFADIASQELVYRDEALVEPTPVALPDRELPLERDCESGVFTPMEHMKSSEQLALELERMRSKFTPFMRRVDPVGESTRKDISFDRFDWRLETAEDRRTFNGAFEGKGDWENVSIPHYGGPIGKATAIYRNVFQVKKEWLEIGASFISFKGVDYKAHVFINSYYVGSHEGFFVPFEFDVSQWLNEGENCLVVRVENDAVFNGNHAWGQPYAGDKIYAATGPGFDEPGLGWHHCPPGMGIYQKVCLEFRPRVFISDVFVRPLLNEQRSEAWIEVTNASLVEVDVSISISVYGRNFEATVLENYEYHPEVVHDCGLGDTFQIAKAKAEGKYLKATPLQMSYGSNLLKISFPMDDFRTWTLDEPWLYQCQVELKDSDGNVVDRSGRHFGMRSFVMDEEADIKGALSLNGNPIRLRGANTMGHEQQCVMREDWDQLRDDILLAKICNMNFLRLTQRPVQEEVYNFCDMLGLMTQTDLPLFGVIRRTQYCEVLRQVGEMEKLVRSHPCNIMVTYINEPTRNADNRPHRHINRDEMENLFAAASDIVHHMNPERVIKPCDGDYDPPSPGIQDRHCYPCWYNGHGMDIGKLHRGYWQPTKPNWFYGCGEFGAEGLDYADLMRAEYPQEWLEGAEFGTNNWSPSLISHAQSGMYHYFFYDTQDSLEDWVEASQKHQALATRIMTEAFRRDERMVTFAIHLFIDAFPAGWMKTIIDCRRRPKPAYFAYRDALAPLLPNLRTDRSRYCSGESIRLEAWVCNDSAGIDEFLFLNYYFEAEGEILASGKASADVRECNSQFQGFLTVSAPVVRHRMSVHCHLALVNEAGLVRNDCELRIEVFPKLTNERIVHTVVLGTPNGKAAKLAEAVELTVLGDGNSLSDADTILIDDFDAYLKNKADILLAVERGARVVFLNLQPGEYSIGGSLVSVKTSDFNPLYFVSRKTGSPYVEGFRSHDFNHWYDPEVDRLYPLLEATFSAPGFEAILTSGNTKDGKWAPALAVAEKRSGEAGGLYCICQVDLAGRVSTNPPAKIFANRILGLSDSFPEELAGVTNAKAERVEC